MSYKTIALTIVLSVVCIALGYTLALYVPPTFSSQSLTKDKNSNGITVSNFQTLTGTIIDIQDRKITLAQPKGNTPSTAEVLVATTTTISKVTPKKEADMQAAYAEYQKMQAAPGGKPFSPPEPYTSIPYTFSSLRTGDPVLIVVSPRTNEAYFYAVSIELLQKVDPKEASQASSTKEQ